MKNPATPVVLVAAFAVGIGSCAGPGEAPSEVAEDFGHFHPKGKPPSEYTKKIFE